VNINWRALLIGSLLSVLVIACGGALMWLLLEIVDGIERLAYLWPP